MTDDQQKQLLSVMEALAHLVATVRDIEAVWALSGSSLQALVGHRMFTVLRYDEAAGTVTRIYSDTPEHYQVGGTKKMGPTPWGDHVLRQGRPFVGVDTNAMQWAFPDHQYLASIGMESVLNLPMRIAGTTLGTINLTHESGHYRSEHIQPAMMLTALLTPVLTTPALFQHTLETTSET